MSQRTCRVAGCGKPTVGRYSRFCANHRVAIYRHGHPLQKGLRATDLVPYVKEIARLRKADPDAPLWTILETHWERLIRTAEESAKGSPFKYVREAASMVLRVAKDTEATKVVDTMLAFFMLWVREPRRFMSDQAADYQLARRFRGLATSFRGTYPNHETGGLKYVYRPTTPRAMKTLAKWVKDTFGAAGVGLCKRIDDEKEAPARAKAALREAIDALQITSSKPRVTSLVIPVPDGGRP